MPMGLDVFADALIKTLEMRHPSEALAGAVGGPVVIGTLTPHRNAMTLAAKNPTASLIGLYRQVFQHGFVRAYTGGSRPMLAAIPQFTAIGPLYLVAERKTGSTLSAITISSVAESLLSYAAQKRNAQISYNATRASVSEHIAYQPLNRLAGPGFIPHVARNMFAMMGIRLFSPYSLKVVEQVPGSQYLGKEGQVITADFASSVVASILSMPFNHIFSWAACTPELEQMSWSRRCKASSIWLLDTYRERGARLLGRDLMVRIIYSSLLFTGYKMIERRMVALGHDHL